MRGWIAPWSGGRAAVLVKLGVLVLAGTVTVLDGHPFWAGSWKAALDWGTVSTALIGPLAAGLAAATYARIARGAGRDALDASPRPLLAWTAPALCLWCLAGSAMTAITLVLTAAVGLSGLRAYPQYLWVLPAAGVVLLAQVAIGAALGTRVAAAWIAPIATIVVFGLGVLGAVGLIAPLFDTGGVTSPLAGEGFSAAYVGAQTLACAGLTALAGLVAAPRLWHTGTTRIAAVALIAAGLAAYVDLRTTHGDRYVTAAAGRVCAGQRVTLCTAAETTRSPDRTVEVFDREIEVLDRLGVAHPDRWEEPLPGAPSATTSGVLLLTPGVDPRSLPGSEAIAVSIATPAPCTGFANPAGPPISALNAQHLLADYLLAEIGAYRPAGDAPDARWLARPESVKASWIRTTYAALRSCRLDALRLPDGVRIR